MLFRSQTRTLFEAYYAASCALQGLERPVPLREVHKQIAEQFERAALIGEVERREAANPVTFTNAVELLLRRKVLERRSSPGARDEIYARGPAFDDLPALRERLAAALSAR